MRIRTIKPGLFKNHTLASLGPHAVVLFEGLWCMADREGRLKYRPPLIRAEVMPYWPDVDVAELLRSLATTQDDDGHTFITIYAVDGCKYIQVNAFLEHQRPHVKEGASTIPAPTKEGASTYLGDGEHALSLGSGKRETGSENLRVPEPIGSSPTPKRRRAVRSNGHLTYDQLQDPDAHPWPSPAALTAHYARRCCYRQRSGRSGDRVGRVPNPARPTRCY